MARSDVYRGCCVRTPLDGKSDHLMLRWWVEFEERGE